MIRSVVLLVAALALPFDAAAEDAHTQEAHLAEAGTLRLVHAWSRATDAGEALVFIDIENKGTDLVSLTGGESALAASVDVVGFQMQGGTGSFVPLGALPIAAGTEMVLSPEGVALRLTGLNQPLRQGETFPMEIHFGDMHAEVTVAIEAADARQHSHAGHEH